MATYVTKRCPHCGYIYQNHDAGEQRKYGCPRQICTRCLKPYWDTDIKEPALYGYENMYEIMHGIGREIKMLIYIPLGLIMFGTGLFMTIERGMLGLFLIALGGLLIGVCVSYGRQKISDKNNRDKIIAKQQEEYDASIKRLQDTNYLTALATKDSRAKKVLYERVNKMEEHYAERPK